MLSKTHEYLKQEFYRCYPAPADNEDNKKQDRQNYEQHGKHGNSKHGRDVKHGEHEATSWYELIFFIANCMPSEIEIAKRMNCYDFMQLLNVRLKSIKL